MKRKLVLPATSVEHFLKDKEIKNERDIYHHVPTKKHIKKKSLIPPPSLDKFKKQQGIVIGDERKHINHTVADVEYTPTPSIHLHNKESDSIEDEVQIGKDAVNAKVFIDCSTKSMF